MADKEDKKAKRPAKAGAEAEQAAKPAKGEKADKAPKAAQAGKGDKGAKAGGEKAAGEKVAREPEPRVPARLRVEFDEKIRGKLAEQFGYKNRMQIPVLDKIVINMGIGEGVADRKKVDAAASDLALISGQKAVITKARKSIATYKLRDGQAIGCKVTLRKARMYEFLDRLINIALPRVRDFRGVSPKAFDGRGNYTLGVRDHFIFPEIYYARTDKSIGLNVTIVTTAGRDDRARTLLQQLGMPWTLEVAAAHDRLSHS